MKNILFLIFIGISAPSIAQTYNADKVNKKAIDLYERALLKVQDGQLKEAIPGLKKAIETEPKYADAILSLASVYGEMKDYKTAVEQFEKGRAIDTNYFRFFYLPYSINLAGLGRF
jgi:Tfp pilus assembly protein PilF